MSVRRQISSEMILQAAEHLFRKYGFRKTGVVDVARELGTSPANIYRFFRSKDELRRAVIRRFLDASHAMALDISRLPSDATTRIKKSLKAQFLMTTNIIDNHRTIHDLIALSVQRDDDLVAFQVDRLREVLASVIKDGIDNGEFGDQNARATAGVFIFAASALWHPTLLQNTRTRHAIRVDDLIEFLLDGIRSGDFSTVKRSDLP